VFYAVVSEQTTLALHLAGTKSWLAANARRLRLLGAYEDTADDEIKWETRRIARETLGGEWSLVSKPWELRRDGGRNKNGRSLYACDIKIPMPKKFSITEAAK
jgi:hypothetical protein